MRRQKLISPRWWTKVHSVIKSIEPQRLVDRYESLGVKVVIAADHCYPLGNDIQTEDGVAITDPRVILWLPPEARAFVPNIPGLKGNRII